MLVGHQEVSKITLVTSWRLINKRISMIRSYTIDVKFEVTSKIGTSRRRETSSFVNMKTVETSCEMVGISFVRLRDSQTSSNNSSTLIVGASTVFREGYDTIK